MAPEPSPKGGGGLSLYANLLHSSSDSATTPGTISRAPVVFKQGSDNDAQGDDAAAEKQQISAASLRFQPIKRPQLATQKPKPKPAFPKPGAAVNLGNSPSQQFSSSDNAAPKPVTKSSLADWTSTFDDDDVNGFYGGEKRQRGGRKKRKKNREADVVLTNWDDVYDPSRPNNYEEYKHSDEKVREVREWKDRLYAHRMTQRRSSDYDSDEDYSRRPNRQFAPPSYSFAPPPHVNLSSQTPASAVDLDDTSEEDAYKRRLYRSRQKVEQADHGTSDYGPPPPPPSGPIPVTEAGEGEYAQRQRMSQNDHNETTVESFPGTIQAAQPSPPEPPSRSAIMSTFQPDSATISRAPVRYTLPPPPEDIPATEEELEEVFAKEEPVEEQADENTSRSLRPGQKGFAERLMAKYGWTKGSGLGATGSGITKALSVKVEKQKKKPDSEGGGFATPAGRGKIIGGAKKGEEEGKFGEMSEVIMLRGIVDGMDLDTELNDSQDGGLLQEIGDECAEKYGRVERVYIDRNSGGAVPVFVKFTSQLSALRAVNALEGRVFNGNAIKARFFDTERFEKGIYE